MSSKESSNSPSSPSKDRTRHMLKNKRLGRKENEASSSSEEENEEEEGKKENDMREDEEEPQRGKDRQHHTGYHPNRVRLGLDTKAQHLLPFRIRGCS